MVKKAAKKVASGVRTLPEELAHIWAREDAARKNEPKFTGVVGPELEELPLYEWIDRLARKVNDVNALSFKTRNQVTGRIATQLVPMEDGEAKRKSFGESKDKLIGALAILDLIWRDLSKIQDYVTVP